MADISKIKLPNGSTYDIKDSGAVREIPWTANIKCATWSRLCYIDYAGITVGSSFLLSIRATRDGVVYNDTFHITVSHSCKGRISKLSGSRYSNSEEQIRVLVNTVGACYVELYDNIYNATSATSQYVHCCLIPIDCGLTTKYSVFTDGTTLPSGFIVADSMKTDNDGGFQGTFVGNLKGTAKESNKLSHASFLGNFYSQGDTHWLKLGYWNTTTTYDQCTLLVTSSFWGNQHGSSDIISFQQDGNSNSTRKINANIKRVCIGGNCERKFVYIPDISTYRIYLYVYVNGGNSYGRWNVSIIQQQGCTWNAEFATNQSLSNEIEITYGGNIGSADSLSSNAGSATQPIYFSGGKPVATTYSVSASVPANAKFTDTTYSVATQSANGLMSAADKKKVDNSVNIPFITGTQTAATGSWIGTASTISALTDGLTINYWLPYNGSGNATLNLTLADGTKTGAVNCYYGGTTRLTTHYSAGSVIQMTYRKDVTIAGSSTKYTGWWAKANYNNDTYDRERHTGNIVAGSAIVAGNIIVGLDGKYSHLKTGGSFMTTYPILWAGSAIAANATGNNNYQSVNVDVRTTQNITLTAYKPVYIKGNIVGRLFTPASTAPLTQTVPTTADNYEYMRLGLAYSTTSFKLEQVHPIYKYIPGPGFIEYTQALQVSGGTIKGSLSRDNVPNTAWVNGRSNATFRNTIGPTSDSTYLPLTSAKSQTGSWDVGVYGDSFIIAYVKDADFNTQTNSATIFNFYKSGMQVPKIRANNFALGTEDTAGFHNSLFRGKFLGYSVSSEQWSQITAGTFDDMFIGDFWLINDRAIRILAFDWYYNIGNPKLTKHHIVVAPDLPLGSGKMNNSNVVTGGYYGSLMKQSGLNSSLATLVSMFGDSHVLTRKALLTNSVNGNTPNGSAWYDTRIDLMNETQVFGCIAYEVHSGFANGVDYNQFPMFRLDQKYISANGDWWLRSIASANGFSYVSVGGDPYTGASSDTRFIRPYILIG